MQPRRQLLQFLGKRCLKKNYSECERSTGAFIDTMSLAPPHIVQTYKLIPITSLVNHLPLVVEASLNVLYCIILFVVPNERGTTAKLERLLVQILRRHTAPYHCSTHGAQCNVDATGLHSKQRTRSFAFGSSSPSVAVADSPCVGCIPGQYFYASTRVSSGLS